MLLIYDCINQITDVFMDPVISYTNVSYELIG